MVGTTVAKRVDENEPTAAMMQVKKSTAATTDFPKRAALGDLKNRGIVRTATLKELKDSKIENALRQTKVRNGTSTNIVTAAKTNVSNGDAEKAAPVNVQRKAVTRSNSVRLGISSTNKAGVGLQRHASSNLLVGQSKVKMLTTKVIENKVQQVKIKGEASEKILEKGNTLRREESNLTGKSLNKIHTAITQKSSAIVKSKPALLKTQFTSGSIAIKKGIIIEKTDDKIKDIDLDDKENLVLVSEYVNEIYDYLFLLETDQPVIENHLKGQLEVLPKMRSVLIDWINEVHTQFHLTAETFQMAVAIIDRYLQTVKNTTRSQLQLVGVTALFIAAKYEELFPPAIADFIYITDDTYTGEEIRKMELRILKALDCNLSRPLPIHFLRRFSKAAAVEDRHHTMSKYFLELSMIEYTMTHYKPSEIAAASLFLTLNILGENKNSNSGLNNKHWNSTMKFYSNYSPEHLRPIAKTIASIARNAPNAKLKAVYSKYQASKFQKISMHPELYSTLMDSIISSKQ